MSDQNNPDSLHDNAIGFFFIGLVLLGVLWLVWYYNQTEIRDFVRWVRYGQMWLIQWFVPDDFQVQFSGRDVNWHEGVVFTQSADKSNVTNGHLPFFNALAMDLYKYPFAVISVIMAFWAYSQGPRTHNRRSLGLEQLIDYQAQNFPTITPFVKFNPSKQPPRPPGSPVPADLPLFAEALGPEEWITYNSVPVPDGKIDAKGASAAFQKQLIGRWRGVKKLKPHQQVMFAAFCLKASRKRDEADALLGRLACCWSHDQGLNLRLDKTLLSEARQILGNKSLAEATIKEANQHGFVTTAMIRALQYAREEGGVLAPALFVWLRGYERILWYPLNNLGRQSMHMEALGAMSHFKAERLTRRPIPKPQMDHAVETITEYMDSINARPLPVLDYKNSKKKAVKKAV